MTPRPLALALLLPACAAPAPSPSSSGDGSAPPWAAPPLERAVSVVDGASGERLGLDELLDELARADVVFLGETHTDETTHRVELAVYEGLRARRRGAVVLALEMFERDAQDALDRYLAGAIDEAAFLAASRPWSNYRTGYRPLVESARRAGAPVVASNFPRALRARIAQAGTLEALSEEERRLVPDELLANTPAYWRRVDNAVRGHRSMTGAPPDPDDPRLLATQSLWDNAMGDACARALEEHAGHLVLHVNGGFHSAYGDGTARQLRLRAPGARVRTVAIVPSANPAVAEPRGLPRADFVVFAEARAEDPSQGFHSVHVPRELRYRLHLPEGAADAEPVPLLLWLGGDGLTAEDGLDLWRARLGDAVAVASFEPPYRAIEPDLSAGGRWFFADTFAEDVGALVTGVERAWGYLLRNLPLDPDRVVLAGEGTGATVVAAVALFTGRMDHAALALEPRRFADLADLPLPLPELRGDAPVPAKALRVLAAGADRAWWQGELDAYAEVGLACELAELDADPWRRERAAAGAVRRALGLADDDPSPELGGERLHVLVPTDSPRARHWSRLVALAVAREEGAPVAVLDATPEGSGSTPVATEVRARHFRAESSLPRAPGAFGGTTVVWLPPDVDADELEAWTSLEEQDPLAAASRFHRLRVATASGERALEAVLARLASEGRTNVLVVPATFCADAATMRALERSVRDVADRMTVHWSPGLGGAASRPPAGAARGR